MNPRDRRNRGAPTNVDENFVGLQDFIVDHDRVRRLKASMTLNDRAIGHSAQPVFHSLVGPRGCFIFAGFDSLDIDAHIAGVETVFRAPAGNADRIGTRDERLRWDASRIHARAAEFMAFDNRHGLSGGRKPSRQRRARLARADNDCVEVLHRRGQAGPSMWVLAFLAASSGVLPS